MARNLVFTMKQGEVGKIIDFVLEDVNGLVDLTPYTVTMILSKGGAVVVNNVAVTKAADQVVDKGKASYAFDGTTANLPHGEYKGDLKLTNGGTVLYWPVNADANRTYFTVRMQKPA